MPASRVGWLAGAVAAALAVVGVALATLIGERAHEPAVESGGTVVEAPQTAPPPFEPGSTELTGGDEAEEVLEPAELEEPALAAAGPAREEVAPARAADEDPRWTLVYRHDFADLTDVNAFQSSARVNSAMVSGQSAKDLQKPTLRANVVVIDDPAASDGHALAVYTRRARFETDAGTAEGWTNGRMMIRGHDQAPPVRVRVRLRMTPSIGSKSAVMWWPAGGGWPWEVDFAETFGGKTLDDYWGSRQHIGQRWHADINGDGRAKEQLVHNDAVDATRYIVLDLTILRDRMWIEIDGARSFETRDTRYLPDSPGFFGIGKALTGKRQSRKRTEDAVIVDWLEIYKPGSGS